ncbi:hypothetical protein BJV77DRAFT_960641 [Russula vinacea]|nr:hypothetical protein BJV77DRAFT_960641 [Russula vinacea]
MRAGAIEWNRTLADRWIATHVSQPASRWAAGNGEGRPPARATHTGSVIAARILDLLRQRAIRRPSSVGPGTERAAQEAIEFIYEERSPWSQLSQGAIRSTCHGGRSNNHYAPLPLHLSNQRFSMKGGNRETVAGARCIPGYLQTSDGPGILVDVWEGEWFLAL